MTTTFGLISSLSYTPTDSFALLPRHIARLQNAHAALAAELPECWCSRVAFPEEETIVGELERAVREAGVDQSLRIRLLVGDSGRPTVETFPLSDMPSYRVKLVLDDQPTSYDDPFLKYKTTERSVYDAARARPGATLHPSPEPDAPPFETIMYNTKSEVTETTIANVAFRLLHLGADSPFVTPASSCGLLEGVKRAELLEKGDLIEDVITVEQIKEAAKASNLDVICFNGVRGVYKAFLCIE